MLTYPFPDSSLSALNYRDAQTGGYALFTNMTATLDLNLTGLLCRYGIDSAGGLVEVDPTAVVGDQCGVPGTPPGNQSGATGGGSSTGGLSTFTTLPGDIVGQVPGPEAPSGRLGLPPIPGVPQ